MNKKTFEARTKIKLGKRIYSGDGDIYQLPKYPNRLIKINYDFDCYSHGKTMKLLSYLKRANNPSVVKIHKIGSFRIDEKSEGNQYCYYYIMDKLQRLRGRGVLGTIINYYENDDTVNIPNKKVPPKLKRFILNARKLKFFYCDIHGGNIMMTKTGNYKFIDLESFGI